MRLSRDARTLILIIILLGIFSCWAAMKRAGKMDSPSSYSTGPHGTKAFYLLLEDLKFKVSRHKRSFAEIPDDARVLLMMDPDMLSKRDANTLRRWVEKGNTLIISLSKPLKQMDVLGIKANRYFGSRPYYTMHPKPGRYTSNVKTVFTDYTPMYARRKSGMSVILENNGFIIAAEYPSGRGRIIFVGDPMIFANANIKKTDNIVLATNMIYENAGKNDRVLFSEYKSDPLSDEEMPPMLGIGGKLVLFNLLLVVLLVMISAGRRFGEIHPLKEAKEQRRGWELVRAMAGLYYRANARQHAFAAIYSSFRRELVMKFGVKQHEPPNEVVEAVLRFASVDKSKLESVIKRCERVMGGYEVSDSETILLIRSIEELRRELGIARSNTSK
ncbi:MAG: DUF4350 domain-containing protein [Armatimonadota bacterium]